MSATELIDSRFGTKGNSNSRIRRYHVQLASDADVENIDPCDDAELPVLGTGHSNFPGIVAKTYVLEQRWTAYDSVVAVLYDIPSSLIPTFAGEWQVIATGGIKMTRLRTTISAPGDPSAKKPIVIGPYKYKSLGVNVSDPDATHKAPGPGPGEITFLEQQSTRRPTGAETAQSVGVLILSKRFTRPPYFMRAFSVLRMLNSDIFFGADRWTMRFDSIQARPMIGIASSSYGGLDHAVELRFSYDPETWLHKEVHTWVDEATGAESIVSDLSDNVVTEWFANYLQTSFNSLLAQI